MSEHEAGPELDRLVAEACGEADLKHDWDDSGPCNHYGRVYVCRGCGQVELTDSDPKHWKNNRCYRAYSSDWGAAMYAAEKVGLFAGPAQGDTTEEMLARPDCRLGHSASGWWFITQPHKPRGERNLELSAPTGPLAISRAIVKLSKGAVP